jgi:DNA transposition AAA+ family ATPase
MSEETKKETLPDIRQEMGATARSTWSFGGDTVIRATKDLPEDQRDAIRWLFFYCVENDISMGDAADAIRRDRTTVYRVMRGEYGAKLDQIVEAIQSYRKLCMERSTIAQAEFIETTTARKIWKICDSALVYNSIAFIYGDSQIGKTCALEEYARRNNHGQTKYIRLPASAGVQLMMKEFAEACALSRNCCFEKLRERVLSALDRNHLVIVDEIHQTFASYHSRARISCLEVLREIHDRSNCGMVLCGTNVFREELQTGLHKKLLDQLRRRGIFELQLSAKPPKSDVRAIAATFGLEEPDPEAAQLVDDILGKHGLGKLIRFMQAGSRMARKQGRPLSWKHFVSAHDIIKRLSNKETP